MLVEQLYPSSLPANKRGPEAWDRRRRNLGTEGAIQTLEGAVRYLVFDQMKADRVFSSGASDAVAILWGAIAAIHTDTMAHQRTERLSAAWLPQHALVRWQRDQARADQRSEPVASRSAP